MMATLAVSLAALYSIYQNLFEVHQPAIDLTVVSSRDIIPQKDLPTSMQLKIQRNYPLHAVREYKIKIQNKDDQDFYNFFNNSHYSFNIENGHLLELPEIINTSDRFKNDNFELMADQQGNIFFNKLKLHQEEYIILKLIILYDQGLQPIFKPQAQAHDDEIMSNIYKIS